MVYEPKPATARTATVNREALARYAMDDRRDFADNDRGFLAPFPDTVRAADGRVLFDPAWFDYIGDKAADADLRIDFRFTDHDDETWTMRIRRGVLNARPGASPDTHLTVAGPKAALVAALLKPASATGLAEARKISLDGDPNVPRPLAGLLDDFDPDFPLVTP
jgi:alkyl sulfatase BDS1-like metallo-beta-lactamase superfamily hydrolase